jgi:hypothetical protein
MALVLCDASAALQGMQRGWLLASAVTHNDCCNSVAALQHMARVVEEVMVGVVLLSRLQHTACNMASCCHT